MTTPARIDASSDFLKRSSLGLTVISLAILTPFAINNLAQGRVLQGVWALAIDAIFAFNFWSITSRGRYYSSLTLLGLLPAVTLYLTLAIRTQNIIGVLWVYPAVQAFYLMLPERRAWVANGVLLAVTLPMAWALLEPALAVRATATLGMVSIVSALFVRVISEQQDKLRALAVTDPLTGVYNRTLLEDALQEAIEQQGRSRAPMTLLALDIDHFKRINDAHGHAAGDEALRQTAGALLRRCRRVDKVFRIGGEEFLVLLFGTGREAARQLAEELRQAVSELSLPHSGEMTVSLGLATLEPNESWEAWMQRADEMLYRAKSAGRDRVVG